MPLFQIPLINCNKAFKAGPARAAVFQVTGAKKHIEAVGGWGGGGGGGGVGGGGVGVSRTSSGPL